MTDRYEVIAAKRASCDDAPTIERMCALLGVSKSGFYDWLHRPLSTAQRRRELLADKIAALFEAVGGIYGYRRIHAELVRTGEHVGPELVRALMRQLDLVAVQPRPYRKTTDPDPYAPGTVDLLNRDFTAQQPGTKVVGDITYIRTWPGWLYLYVLWNGFADRLRHPRGDRLRDGRPPAHRTRRRRGGDGDAQRAAPRGLHYAFRPRHAIHVDRIPGKIGRARVAAFGRADRSMLG